MKLTTLLARAVAMMATLACLNLPAHAEVSWMDIISDPDNQALNEQFVTERLAKGDLPAALSAVERLINLRPADVGLRLIRAEILVNLGNDTLATGELDALAQLPMADEQKSRIRKLQSVIKGRAKRWQTVVSGTIGLNGSDNANSYPSSGLLEFKLTPGAATATSTYESFGGAQKTIREVASTASVTAAATYEIANQDRDSITVGASHQEARGRKYEYLTSGTTTVFTGASLKLGSLRLSPSARVSQTQAKTSSDSNVISGSLSAGHALPYGLQGVVSADYSITNRLTSPRFSTADQNDGHSRSYRIGLSRTFMSRYSVFAERSLTTFNPMENRFAAGTNARNQSLANANQTEGATIGFAVTPTRYTRVNASIGSSEAKYTNLEQTSRKFRRDSQTRTSVGFQVSGAAFSDKLAGMTLGLSASTTKNDSNIMQYDYKRSDVSMILSYQIAE